MKQRTVVFTIDNFHVGGVTTFIKQYTSVLLEKNIHIVVVGFKGNLEKPENFFNKCEIRELPGKGRFGLVNRLIDSFRYIKEVKLVYSKYEVLAIHFSTTWSSFYSLLVPNVWKSLKVATFYGAYDLEAKNPHTIKIIDNIKSITRKLLQYLVLLSAAKVVVFSEYSKNLILKHFSTSLDKKTIKIPGLLFDINLNTKQKSDPNILNLVNIGRIENRKGIDILLEIANILNIKKINYKLVIAAPVNELINSGLLLKYEKLNLFDKVQFIHKVNKQQKKEILMKADLFLLPSKDLETFGMTCIEALGEGVPVIGTNIGAIPEILTKYDKRFIVDNNFVKSFVKKIKWYKNLSLKQKTNYQIKAKNAVKNNFIITKYKREILNLYGL